MRHNKKINHLGRTSAHRNAMLANMCISLIHEKRIFTTVAKAKALKKVVEPIITKSKEDTTHSRRLVFQALRSGAATPTPKNAAKVNANAKTAVIELFQNIAPKVANRPGGYTRILKTGTRVGDNASMCFIELVDYNEDRQSSSKSAAEKKTTTRRSRRGGSAKAAATTTAKVETAPKAKATEVVEEVKPAAEEKKSEE